MDRLIALACKLPLLQHVGLCHPSPDGQRLGVEARQQTAPDGQVLPDWLTWSPYETTIDGQVIQTGEILQLPLTYYGPSIPLGPDWTYGGITSPPAQASTEPTPSTTSSESIAASVSSVDPSPVEASQAETPASFARPTSTTPLAPKTQNPLQTGAGPLGTIPSSAAASESSPSPSSSDPSHSSTSAATPTGSNPPTSPPASPPHSNKLLPLLPAILVPLLVAIILILLLVYCFRRRERSKAGYTTAIGASSGGFGGWLTSSFAKRANGSGEGFTSAWTQVPEAKPVKEGSPISPVSAENWQKSNERPALLGFIPNHHRASSSIDVPRPAESAPAVPEKEEELEVLANRNQSLLRRLNLGVGWLSVASLVSSKGSGKSRIASGFTLEKGNGGTGSLGVPKEESGSEKTESADKSGTSGTKGTTSGSASASAAALSNDQLFYRPPHDSTSSRGSTSTRGSPRRGFFSRFKTDTSSKKSKRSSGPSRKSWMSYDVVPEGEEGELLREGSEGMSIAVPRTPSTVEGGKRLSGGMTRWDSRERMRFPLPPGAGGAERASLISTE